MAYPNFAFYPVTQIVLFVVNCVVTTLSYYWGAHIILQIYQKNVSFKQNVLFSFSSAILLNIFVSYGFAYLFNGVNHILHFNIDVFLNLIGVMFPCSYFILYMLGIYILKLSSFKSIKIMQLSYVYFLCYSLVLRIAGSMIFPQLPDMRGWNYLRDILMLLSGILITYCFYRLICHCIKKYKLYMHFTGNIIVSNVRRELIKNFCICCGIYGLILISYFYPRLDGIHCIFLFLILLSYMVISIAYDYNDVYKRKLGNRDEHIAALNNSIEEFRGIKHDFNNILQTYSGYLAIGDYKKLQLYHQRVIHTIVSAETHLDISRRMPENPSFFSLIIYKLEKAQKKGITFRVVISCNMEEIYVDELDFTRIMAILLDNAIEAAEQTPLKRITLSGQLKPDGSKLFILSNDVVDEVNIEALFISGYTTKSGHMGQGLPQVRNILHKYGSSTMNLTFYKGSFTVYLELRPGPPPRTADRRVSELGKQKAFEADG